MASINNSREDTPLAGDRSSYTYRTSWTRGHKALVIFGVGILFVGLILAIGGPIVMTFEFEKIFKEGIEKYDVVDSHDAPGYKNWQGKQDKLSPYYMKYWLYNLTNVDDVLQNISKPVMQLLGPYTYRRYQELQNVTFFDNGEKVSFVQHDIYIWTPSESGRDHTDLITNINPAYMGVMNVAGGEDNMLIGATATVIAELFDFIIDPGIDTIIFSYIPEALRTRQSELISQLNATLGNTELAEAMFYAIWANASSAPPFPPDLNWTCMLVTVDTAPKAPSNISFTSAQLLFDPNSPLSLTNSSVDSTLTWLNATLRTPNTNSSIEVLAAQFGLTLEQVQVVINWLIDSVATRWLLPELLDRFGLDERQDIAWLQWGMGTPLDGNSLAEYYPEHLPLPPEYFVFAAEQHAPGMDVATAKLFLNGSAGIFNPQNIRLLEDALFNPNNNFSAWGMNFTEANFAFGYVLPYIYVIYTPPQVDAALAAGGNLFTTRTALEWIWTARDPLLKLMRPQNTACGLQVNDTYVPITLYTGKGDISKINQFIAWKNQTEIVGVWEEPIPVKGVLENGQFAPFLSSSDILKTWDQDLVRTVPLKKTGSKTLQDIDLWRFQVEESVFDVNTLFHQTIAGFLNMTSYEQGSLVYLSQWGGLDCDPEYIRKVDVLNLPHQSETSSTTEVFVEPITGKSFQAMKRLQINVWNGNDPGWFDQFHTNVTTDIFFPVCLIEQVSELSDDQADEFKSRVYGALRLRAIIFWVSLGLGITFVILGTILLTLGIARHVTFKRASNYRPL